MYTLYKYLSIGSRTFDLKMATANFTKAPPLFKKDDNYDKWKKKLEIWQSFTALEKTKQGPALFLSLDEHSQDAVLKLQPADIAKEDGITKIIQVLDGLYLKDKTQSAFQALEDFFDFKRAAETNINDFINEFDRLYSKAKSNQSKISEEELLAFRLLKSANLSPSDYKLVKGTVPELTYDSMKAQLKKILESGSSSKQVKEEVKVEEDSSGIMMYASGNLRGAYGRPYGRQMYRPFNSRGDFRNPSRGMQPYRGRGSQTLSGSNPLNQFGRVTTCSCCGSRFHWIEKCPDKKMSAAYYEEQVEPEENNYPDDYMGETEDTYCNIVLFQSDYDTPNRFKTLVRESLACAVIDCGASKTVCGQSWLSCYTDCLSESEKSSLKIRHSDNVFKFGDGKCVKSTGMVSIPAVIGGVNVIINTDVVTEYLPLLMSKESLKRARAEINFIDDSIHIMGQRLKLVESQSGHYMLPLTRTRACLEASASGMDAKVTLIARNMLTCKDKAIKLHRQFAHPAPKKLISLLKSSGTDDKELEEEIHKTSKRCKVCKELKRPPPRPVVGLPMATKFGECVAMDLKKFRNGYLLHVIDHATRLSACAPILNKLPETIIKELFRIWIAVYGVPEKFLSDNGGEFSNSKFRELCEKVNITVHTTAAEAPWSNGLCERHNLVIAEMVTKVMDDTNCSVGLAVNWAVHAKNSLANVHGFSPYQLVFGRNPNIPGVLTDKPPALYGETSTDIVRENLNALHRAREAFIRSESSEKVRRALRHNVRGSADTRYVTGDTVYYKRVNEKKWQGPAKV